MNMCHVSCTAELCRHGDCERNHCFCQRYKETEPEWPHAEHLCAGLCSGCSGVSVRTARARESNLHFWSGVGTRSPGGEIDIHGSGVWNDPTELCQASARLVRSLKNFIIFTLKMRHDAREVLREPGGPVMSSAGDTSWLTINQHLHYMFNII